MRTFFWDQMLFARRGVYRTNHQSASRGFARPSIQPKQRAVSTASAGETDWMPEAFLANFRWKPGAVACSRSRNVSRWVAVGNAWMGRSVGGCLGAFGGIFVGFILILCRMRIDMDYLVGVEVA